MIKPNFLMKGIPLALLGAFASSQTLADESFSVVGSWSSLPLYKQYEQPFWTDILPSDSKGEFEVVMTTHDQMGIGTGDVFRMLGDGVFDVAMTSGDYAVADAPALEGLDVPLLARLSKASKKTDRSRSPYGR
ncbi:hypothetical protein [Marinomonas sp. GJ51-6]|uniref:hypothetical protein n=1 Tax=Marinomonas sp. GJ51-6 TaxID=2992802 RepID=UPI0029349312|nr:hypothetical protein [Marinomonas sp. GJ51-6]WOD09098.1 hypothetical protein ONZ50_08770 [Marinomonas sp. GJ51-6]